MAGLVQEKHLYSTNVLTVGTPLFVLALLLLGNHCRWGQQRLLCFVWSLLPSRFHLPASGYRVRCEACQWSRGFRSAIRNTGSWPGTTPQLPCLDQVDTNHMWEPEPPLHEQIMSGDWLVRLISFYFHKHANRNNTGLSVLFPSVYLCV